MEREDKADFVDVTIGVSRLQRLVHLFEGLGQIPEYDAKRRVLLAAAPGEQHSLGSTIVQKFLRAGGWHVWSCASPNIAEPAEIVATEWFGVVGFSLGSDVHVEQLGPSGPFLGLSGEPRCRPRQQGRRRRNRRQRPRRGGAGQEAAGRSPGLSLHPPRAAATLDPP